MLPAFRLLTSWMRLWKAEKWLGDWDMMDFIIKHAETWGLNHQKSGFNQYSLAKGPYLEDHPVTRNSLGSMGLIHHMGQGSQPGWNEPLE